MVEKVTMSIPPYIHPSVHTIHPPHLSTFHIHSNPHQSKLTSLPPAKQANNPTQHSNSNATPNLNPHAPPRRRNDNQALRQLTRLPHQPVPRQRRAALHRRHVAPAENAGAARRRLGDFAHRQSRGIRACAGGVGG
ncbi:hypothetical protein DM02DRAFT_135291 [Periconia macrospinosa]|uniref:Uncharacterized protein n=1 Tax=Periconia macrospinosa TaxID=97972 RepID=A0A2V1E6U1_9PLEO|nr:hypothetical protein DM02DRAFT_135291 [Periconia macrospinosa]